MDKEQINFTWGIAQEILNDLGYVQVTGFMLDGYSALGLTRPEFLCILHLARYHYNIPKGLSKPSQSTIAKQMGYAHVNSVRQLIRKLKDKGMLLVEQAPGKECIYDASPFALATFELWKKRKTTPTSQYGGIKDAPTPTPQCGGTPTPQCGTPLHPDVDEENRIEIEVKEKGSSKSSKLPPSIPSKTIEEDPFCGLVETTIEKLSRTFGDVDHLKSNISQAYNIWDCTDLEGRDFVDELEKAAAITKKRISKSVMKDRDRRMAYFFRVLRNALKLK